MFSPAVHGFHLNKHRQLSDTEVSNTKIIMCRAYSFLPSLEQKCCFLSISSESFWQPRKSKMFIHDRYLIPRINTYLN